MYKMTTEMKDILRKLVEDLQANKVCKAKIVAKYTNANLQECDFDSTFWYRFVGLKLKNKDEVLRPLKDYLLGSIEGGLNQCRVKIELEYYDGVGFVIQTSTSSKEL